MVKHGSCEHQLRALVFLLQKDNLSSTLFQGSKNKIEIERDRLFLVALPTFHYPPSPPLTIRRPPCIARSLWSANHPMSPHICYLLPALYRPYPPSAAQRLPCWWITVLCPPFVTCYYLPPRRHLLSLLVVGHSLLSMYVVVIVINNFNVGKTKKLTN